MKTLFLLFAMCSYEDVQQAEATFEKYDSLYEAGIIDYARYYYAENHYFKTMLCADLMPKHIYCYVTKEAMEGLKEDFPFFYKQELENFNLTCADSTERN